MSPIQLPVSRRSQDLFYDDQKLIDDALYDIENQKFGDYSDIPAKRSSRKRKFFLLLGLLSSYLVLYLISAPLQKILPEEISSFPKTVYQNVFTGNNAAVMPINAATPSVELNVTEVFEVLPVLSPPLGSFEYADVLIEEQAVTKDSVFNYTAPETFNFTDVLLTLNFSTFGAQSPLIFDIYLDDYPIWRTSTPDPLDSGNLTISSTTKNLTDYLSLFKSNRDITLNLVDGSLTGNVNVSLSAVFYNSTLTGSGVLTTPAAPAASLSAKFTATDLFVATKPADIIYPISNDGSSYHLPKENMKIKLPKLPKNVTIARLELFASTSEEEIAYYKNAIGKNPAAKAVGPLRAINVFIDSVFIAAISPNPSLLRADKFGSSISSAKSWLPVAATGTFDALSYELDLTSVLPLLWKGEVTLEVEVVTLVKSSTMIIPFLGGPVPLPGSDADLGIEIGTWDVTGNLLAWESEFVNAAKGEIISAESLINGTGILIGPPGGFYESQIVRGDIDSSLVTVLNFTLFDNTTLSVKSTLNSTCGAISLNQKTHGMSPSEGLTLISTSKFNFIIENNTLPTLEEDGLTPLDPPLFTYNKTTAFPMIIKETLASKPIWGPATNGSIEFKVGYGFQTMIDGDILETFNSRQNSTIDDLGVMTDSSTLIQLADAPLPFSRDISCVDGVIVKDSLILDDFISEYLDFSYIVNFDELFEESSNEDHEIITRFFEQ